MWRATNCAISGHQLRNAGEYRRVTSVRTYPSERRNIPGVFFNALRLGSMPLHHSASVVQSGRWSDLKDDGGSVVVGT